MLPDETQPLAPDAFEQAARGLFGAPVTFPGSAFGNPVIVEHDGAEFELRRWPAGTTEATVTRTQASLAAASAVNPVFPVPVPVAGNSAAWAVSEGGDLYSARSVLAGRPLMRYGEYLAPNGEPIHVPLPASSSATDILLAAVGAMGQYHTVNRTLVTRDDAGARSIHQLLRSTRTTWSEQRRVVGDRAASAPEIRRWLRCGNRVLPVATEMLDVVGEVAGTSTLIHGELWPVDLRVDGQDTERRLSGITGWTTVTQGSPLIDLAQLAVHTTGWSGAVAEAVLGAYAETGQINPVERRLLPVVAALDLVTRVGNLLHLAYVDDQMIGHEAQPVIRSGMKLLLSSLENLTDVMVPKTGREGRQQSDGRGKRPVRPVRKSAGPRTTPVQKRGSGRSGRG